MLYQPALRHGHFFLCLSGQRNLVEYCNAELDKEGDCYCNVCKRYVEPITQGNLQHELQEWWNMREVSELEEITGLPPATDGSTGHYNAFWNKLSFSERVKFRQDYGYVL